MAVPSDLVNELSGARALLESITANGEDHDAQLRKMFVSFNARISKLQPTTAGVLDAITAAISDGPWTPSQSAALLALTTSVMTVQPKARPEDRAFQHCLRCSGRAPLTRCTRERCSQYVPCYSIHVLAYAHEQCSRHRFESYGLRESQARGGSAEGPARERPAPGASEAGECPTLAPADRAGQWRGHGRGQALSQEWPGRAGAAQP